MVKNLYDFILFKRFEQIKITEIVVGREAGDTDSTYDFLSVKNQKIKRERFSISSDVAGVERLSETVQIIFSRIV
jgi:hypothetical protein